jgi:hypothetical protein
MKSLDSSMKADTAISSSVMENVMICTYMVSCSMNGRNPFPIKISLTFHPPFEEFPLFPAYAKNKGV